MNSFRWPLFLLLWVRQILLSWAPKSLWTVTAAMKLRYINHLLAPCKESQHKPRQRIKKQSTHFANKGPYSQSCGFSSSHVQMWAMDYKEGWPPKNWHFQFWCWRRLLRVPWTARRSNQPTRKEFNHAYSLEGLMLKLQYFGIPDVKSQLIGKDPMLVKILGRSRWQQRMGWLDGIISSMNMSLSKFGI